jgi:hypothetical protein
MYAEDIKLAYRIWEKQQILAQEQLYADLKIFVSEQRYIDRQKG